MTGGSRGCTRLILGNIYSRRWGGIVGGPLAASTWLEAQHNSPKCLPGTHSVLATALHMSPH